MTRLRQAKSGRQDSSQVKASSACRGNSNGSASTGHLGALRAGTGFRQKRTSEDSGPNHQVARARQTEGPLLSSGALAMGDLRAYTSARSNPQVPRPTAPLATGPAPSPPALIVNCSESTPGRCGPTNGSSALGGYHSRNTFSVDRTRRFNCCRQPAPDLASRSD
jgi:hypothetical protein